MSNTSQTPIEAHRQDAFPDLGKNQSKAGFEVVGAKTPVNEKAKPPQEQMGADNSISVLIGAEVSRPDRGHRKEEKKRPHLGKWLLKGDDFQTYIGYERKSMYERYTKGTKVWFAVGKGGRLKIIETGKATCDDVPSPIWKGQIKGLAVNGSSKAEAGGWRGIEDHNTICQACEVVEAVDFIRSRCWKV